MSKVCSNDGWHKQNDEVQRLIGRAQAERRAKFEDPAGFRGGDPSRHWGSKFDFASRLDWFITAMTAKIALPTTAVVEAGLQKRDNERARSEYMQQ
jgi:hypothetical protein